MKKGIDYLLDTESEYDQMDTQRFLDNYKKNLPLNAPETPSLPSVQGAVPPDIGTWELIKMSAKTPEEKREVRETELSNTLKEPYKKIRDAYMKKKYGRDY